MKNSDLMTFGIISDILNVSNGHRLYLKKKYSNTKMNMEDWIKVCEKENITIKKITNNLKTSDNEN